MWCRRRGEQRRRQERHKKRRMCVSQAKTDARTASLPSSLIHRLIDLAHKFYLSCRPTLRFRLRTLLSPLLLPSPSLALARHSFHSRGNGNWRLYMCNSVSLHDDHDDGDAVHSHCCSCSSPSPHAPHACTDSTFPSLLSPAKHAHTCNGRKARKEYLKILKTAATA